MKRVPVGSLEAGMKVAKTVYTADGNILLNSGMRLKESYIERLKDLGIMEIYIINEELPEFSIPEPLSDKTRLKAINVIKETMKQIKVGHSIDSKEIKEAVDDILNEILLQNHVIIHLSDIRSYDNYTFHHSVSVTILAVLIALNFDYNIKQLKKIATGAFLHDLGKIMVEPEIIKKSKELTDEEYKEVKKHPDYGYELLRELDGVSILSAHVAYQHHEHYDGSGYPRGLTGDEINEFAQIVTVADIYDALTSDRIYKRKLRPDEALKIIQELRGTKLNPKFVDVLHKHIATYPVGTVVALNTQEIGLVVDVNKENLSEPIVRIIRDQAGEKVKEVKEIDLIHNQDVEIEEVLEF
ncbi:HD-GYP domain-containing protein [Natroniella sulfidigena]|uniref:HD-GYP domain-containing protein n=1 Tax=Natroniella sulfidigena TaxID=723921 RepID=UPI00200A456B|nr:HD-GYP domain-containing protein [Natroniella sulfidigena]MCK8816047.1 HD-GYP domain-containing protein [Natroniella sulfidigena]